ncbi:MAG: META domain-containing protein [Ferruginibacter sp.]
MPPGSAKIQPPSTAQDSILKKLNGTWQLNYITGPRIAFTGLYPGKKPTLVFNLSSTGASGNTGCNSFTSKVSIDGNKIKFAEPLATRMACEGNGEQVFLKTLERVDNFTLVNSTTLTMNSGDYCHDTVCQKINGPFK